MSCYRLGVLSDTHLTNIGAAMNLASKLINGPFGGVDAILHAGDMLLADFESCFNEIPFYSVRGNMDASRTGLPYKRIVEFEPFRVGLIHGWGKPAEVPQNALSEFTDQTLDVLVFGHSHTPVIARVGGTLLLNPGSALDHRGRAERCSVGLLTLGTKVQAEIIYL